MFVLFFKCKYQNNLNYACSSYDISIRQLLEEFVVVCKRSVLTGAKAVNY